MVDNNQYVIHSWYGNPRGNMCQIVADLVGVQYQFPNTTFLDAKKPEYLLKHPLGKSPLLETPEGNLFETNAIMRYLARKSSPLALLGKNLFEEGRVNQWLDILNLDFQPVWASIFMPHAGYRKVEKKDYVESKKKMFDQIQYFDKYLQTHTFLAGHQLTIADVALFCWTNGVVQFIADDQFRAKNFSFIRWYEHVFSNAAIQKFYRKPFYPKFDKLMGKQQQHEEKKEGAKKEETKEGGKKGKDAGKQSGQNTKVVAEKPAKKKSEDQGDDDDEKPATTKAKNPLDLIETKYDFYNFKTEYTNGKDKKVELEKFWATYDQSAFSVWQVKYQRYDGDGKLLWKTMNKRDITIQNLSDFRKYTIGQYGVYGDEGDYEIRGVFIWKGLGIPKEAEQNFEYHDFVKLDPKNPQNLQLIYEYWLGTEEGVSKAEGLTLRGFQAFK